MSSGAMAAATSTGRIAPTTTGAAVALAAFEGAVTLAGSERAALADFGLRKPPAFAAAGRHSQRVRFLRRAIIVVCVAAIALLAFVSIFDPLGKLKGGFTIGSVGIDGTKVTMHDPKLSGTRRDGGAYEVKAGTATQDTTVANILDLTSVDLKLGQTDGSTTRITARTGRYNTDLERLDLAGSVRFLNEGHYDMALQDAVMDLKGGELTTRKPAVVTIPGGRVESETLTFSETTHVVAFEGNVRSVFTQDASTPPAAAGRSASAR